MNREQLLLRGAAEAAQALLVPGPDGVVLSRSLGALGEAAGVDRAYVFENSEDPATGRILTSQRFEWTRDDVRPEISNPLLQDLPLEEALPPGALEKLSAGFAIELRVSEMPPRVRAILGPQGILSLVLTPIHLGGRFWGFLGLDDCHTEREWTEGERSILAAAAAGLGGFLARRLAEEARSTEEERFRSLVEGTHDCIWEIDSQGRFTYVSAAIREMTGIPPAEVLHGTPEAFVDPERIQGLRVGMAAIFAAGKPFSSLRYAVRHRDGRKLVLEASGRPFFDEAGNLAGFRGTTRDATERVRAEELQAALFGISEAATTSPDLPDLYRRVHEILAGLMPARNLYIALCDEGRQRLEFPYWVDDAEPPPAPQPFGRGLTEYVIRTGRTLLASPEEFDELIASGEVDLLGASSVDWLGAPLRTKDRTIGVLAVQSYTEGTRYREGDAKMLGFVSAQVAMAIEHKRRENALVAATAEMKASIGELELRNREISDLAEMGRLLQACRTSAEVHAVTGRFVPLLFPGSGGSLLVTGREGGTLAVAAAWGEAGTPSRPHERDDCWSLRLFRPHLGGGPGGLRCPHLAGSAAAWSLCVPLTAQREVLGVLSLERAEAWSSPVQGASAERLAATTAKQISLALANLLLREILREQATRDPLTGLFNRRHMEEALQREVRRAARRSSPLGILMLDLDHFKEFNDARGHEAGDALLRALGKLIQKRIRAEDIACRYGGEEFTLILPDAAEPDVLKRAEELRRRVARIEVETGDVEPGAVTVSIGAASFPRHGDSAAALLRSADEALYRAKAEGRDRVVLAAPVPAAAAAFPQTAPRTTR